MKVTAWGIVSAVLLTAVLAASHLAAYRAGGAADRAALNDYIAQTAQAARDGEVTQRAEELRRQAAQRRIDDEADRLLHEANAAAADAYAVADSLRRQLAYFTDAHKTGGDTAAAQNSAAASDALDLLAELFSRADDTAGELAQAADAAHIAGLTCERAYDALTAQGSTDDH
jgi:hypothetical protein